MCSSSARIAGDVQCGEVGSSHTGPTIPRPSPAVEFGVEVDATLQHDVGQLCECGSPPAAVEVRVGRGQVADGS
jgi:hypothetical protein